MKILLVDDDPGVLECCAILLDHLPAGHVVVTATSVSEALALLEASSFDAVVADYLFTDARWADSRTGGDLLAIVASRFPRVRRMIFSAAAVPTDVDAHIVLDKMAGMEAFLARIEELARL
jgi:DNA-binding NarL/FixJ family response regulator